MSNGWGLNRMSHRETSKKGKWNIRLRFEGIRKFEKVIMVIKMDEDVLKFNYVFVYKMSEIG